MTLEEIIKLWLRNVSKNRENLLFWSSSSGSVFDIYNNFGFRCYSYYPAREWLMKPCSDFIGRSFSQQALKFKGLSRTIKGFGNIVTGLMVLSAANNIYEDGGTFIDYSDGFVGISGLTNSVLLQWKGIGSQSLGGFVGIYGFGRLPYDFVGKPNVEKIQNNITNNKYPLDGLYNPTTGMYDRSFGW